MPVVVALALGAALVLRLAMAYMGWTDQVVARPDGQPGLAGSGTREVDLPAVQALKLFADNNTLAGAGVARAKVATTDLDLGLEGVVLASDPKDSRALIISNGQQRSYKSGDTLPVGAGVTLAGIAQDHVLIRNNGIEQALWLFDADPQAKPAKAGASAGKANTQSGLAAGKGIAGDPLLQAAPQQIHKASGRLAEIMEVAPVAANGQLLGYMLSPGMRLKEFVQLGFQTNDIVTSVNGIALNDKANLSELYSLMNKPGDVSFSLLRSGKPVTLQMTLTP